MKRRNAIISAFKKIWNGITKIESGLRMEERIIQITKRIPQIPQRDLTEIADMLEHNEWGLAFEIVCSSVTEGNITIDKETYAEKAKVGLAMGMESARWDHLAH